MKKKTRPMCGPGAGACAGADAEEREPLNTSDAMVAENFKKAIIGKICRDVDKKVATTKHTSSTTNPHIFRQYLLAIGASFAGLSSGMTAGFSAILLPQLNSAQSTLTITKEESSWIASMAALPMMVGCLCSGYPMDRLGRRISIIVSSIIFTGGWAVLAYANTVIWLYVGRFITGFAVGLMAPMVQVYIAETSAPKHRGILLSAAPLSVAVGILASHLLGTYLPWQAVAFICGIPPLVCVLITLLVKESPIWLLGAGKPMEAQESYQFYHGRSEKVKTEWENTVSKIQTSDATGSDAPSKLSLILTPSFLKPFFVLNAFFFVQQFSGVNAVAFYSVNILKEVIPKIDGYLATIIIDVVRLVISFIGVLLLKKYGRKTLAIISAVGTAISLFSLSAYLAVADKYESYTRLLLTNMTSDGGDISKVAEEGFSVFHSLPLVCLILYICFVSIGLVPIPWVLTGELFSKELRGVGSGVTSSFGFICYFSVVKSSPDLFENFGKAGTFSFFGCVCVFGSVMLALCLPETKDKTLLEIEAYYLKKGEKNDEETATSAS